MKTYRLLVILLAVVFMLVGTASISAQSTTQSTTQQQPEVKEQDETNLDTQLYLIVGTNQVVPEEKLPASLDSVVKQLRATLPFKNYRLAATLINRVKNDGRLDLSWIGGPLAVGGSNSVVTPSFSQFKVRQIRLTRNATGEQLVQMAGFNFGARIPIQTGAVAAVGGIPATNYENTGLSTDISIREGEPVVVGTLNIGPSGDAIILVVSAKRTAH